MRSEAKSVSDRTLEIIMKKGITRLALVVAVAAATLLLGAAGATANPAKTDICHYSEEQDDYHLISVSDRSLPAHMAHGDGLPGGAVPGESDFLFDANCAQFSDYNGNGIPDVDEPQICVHVDGVLRVQNGTTTCASSQGNIAIATGADSSAVAPFGTGNRAVVEGERSTAEATAGNGNTAIVTGNDSSALAGFGDDNTATTTGNNSTTRSVLGLNNVAVVVGDGSASDAGFTGDNNDSTVIGDGSGATAGGGDNNVSLVSNVDGATAHSGFGGNNNTATATADGALASAAVTDGNVAEANAPGCVAIAHGGGEVVACV